LQNRGRFFLFGRYMITNRKIGKHLYKELIHDITIPIKIDLLEALIERSIDDIFFPGVVERFSPTASSARYIIIHPKYREIGEINLLVINDNSSILNIKIYLPIILGPFSAKRSAYIEELMRQNSGILLARLRSELINLGIGAKNGPSEPAVKQDYSDGPGENNKAGNKNHDSHEKSKKRGPNIGTIERVKDAIKYWLDGGSSFNSACELAGVDDETVKSNLSIALRLFDEQTRDKYTKLIVALGKDDWLQLT